MARQEKVLIIDDEPAIRELVARALLPHGYDCRSAADAKEALAAAAVERPALALVDLRLSGPDGMWLLAHFKSRWPDMAVVMLTGVNDARTAIECLKRGADDYLMKPVHLDELALAARRARERARLTRENREYQRNLERMVKERTAQLQNVLNVVDRTYQLTIGALVSPVGLETTRGALPSVVPLPDTPALARFAKESTGESEPVDSTAGGSSKVDKDLEVELSALRTAGELITEGASSVKMATTLGTELVGRRAAQFVRLWVRQRGRRGLALVADKGEGPSGTGTAERALLSRAVESEEGQEAWMVSAPIFVRDCAEAVWQVGGDGRTPALRAPLVTRLALLVGAALARERDAEESRKTSRELDLLYEMASATQYTFDLQSVAQFIIESLHKVVDYDLAGLLLLDKQPHLHILTRRPSSAESIDRVRLHILNTLSLTCGLDPGKELITRVSRMEAGHEGEDGPLVRMRSFINTPLTLGGAVVGLFHVSSAREEAFSAEDALFLNRVAHFLASSVQGIRHVLATVKGRVERMVDHMTDGVLMLDARGDVVAMNQAARSILKAQSSSDTLDSAAISHILDFDPLHEMRAERRVLRRVVVLQGVPYQAQLSPVEDGAGELLGAVLAFRNFTQEQRVDEMKSEFISIVSHEIRTPITVVKNAVELMAQQRLGAVTAEQSRFLGLARRNIDQLIVLINDLLDLSKIEAGKFHVRLRPLALNETVERVVSSFQPQAEEKGILLECAVGRLPLIRADRECIQRVLLNLVGNALKFTARGGRIRVEASRIEESREPGSRESIRVTVSDSGVGIPPDHLQAIFEKFHQVDGSRSQGVAGTGLGLPITRELVRAHYGDIWAESEPGRGSRFIFVIPVLGAEEVAFRALARALERAAQAGTSLALLILRLIQPERLRSQLGDEQFGTLLEVLEAAAQQVTRRPTDQVELGAENGELVALLPDTSPQGGRAFGERLLQKLQEVSASAAAHIAFEWTWAMAAYPEDGATADAVYSVARQRLEHAMADVR
jgi:signal transduction histidine kinase/ActR/RegA family two-component response regulator